MFIMANTSLSLKVWPPDVLLIVLYNSKTLLHIVIPIRTCTSQVFHYDHLPKIVLVPPECNQSNQCKC